MSLCNILVMTSRPTLGSVWIDFKFYMDRCSQQFHTGFVTCYSYDNFAVGAVYFTRFPLMLDSSLWLNSNSMPQQHFGYSCISVDTLLFIVFANTGKRNGNLPCLQIIVVIDIYHKYLYISSQSRSVKCKNIIKGIGVLSDSTKSNKWHTHQIPRMIWKGLEDDMFSWKMFHDYYQLKVTWD